MKQLFKAIRTAGLSAIGVPKVAQFAVTNRCSSKCKICSIWKQKEKVSVSLEDGLNVIDKLAKMGVMQLTFTGGEPLANPHIYDFIQRANENQMYIGLCVGDPRLLTEKNIKKLHDCGSVLISMSFDTDDPDLNSELRDVPDIHTHFQRVSDLVHKYNVNLVAAPTITEYTWNRIPEIIEKARVMGFDFMNISYPTQSLSKTFQIGSDDTSHISLTKDQIIFGMHSLLEHINTKNNKPFVINPPISIKNMINYLNDPRSVKYHCLGGWKVFAIDWFLDVYSCWRSDKKLGNILDPAFELKKTQHNACTMSWYRDFSVFFQDNGQTAMYHAVKGNFGKFVRLLG
jgi:MoaA/NifB/PqqE/SkfB family radical SAM enzyme